MKRAVSCFVLASLAFASCLSKTPAIATHSFRPVLPAIRSMGGLGTRPLRFDGLRAPLELGTHMTWRISVTELSADELNLWARSPAELLDERLRDLLFGAGGFRDTSVGGGPQLNVQLTVFEGDVSGPEALAVVELIVDLDDGKHVQHRTRLRVEEPLAKRDAEGLARAMGPAMSSAAQRCVRWIDSQLSGR